MVPSHPTDVLDEPSGLGGSIGRSFAAHVAVVATLVAWGIWRPEQKSMGDMDAQGGAIGVGVVNSIPLPQSSGIRNPVADESESKAPREKEKDDEGARPHEGRAQIAKSASRCGFIRAQNQPALPGRPRNPRRYS